MFEKKSVRTPEVLLNIHIGLVILDDYKMICKPLNF